MQNCVGLVIYQTEEQNMLNQINIVYNFRTSGQPHFGVCKNVDFSFRHGSPIIHPIVPLEDSLR